MLDTVYSTSNAHAYTILSSVLNGMMLIPYLLLFLPSGFIADRWPKVTVLRLTAAAAMPLTLLLTLCYYMGWFWLAFSMTLLMATQSVLNSPAKYGYIRETFGKSEIARVNGWVQALVIMGIVLAQAFFTFVANAIVSVPAGEVVTRMWFIKQFAPLGFLLFFMASLEYYMVFKLLPSGASDPDSSYSIKNYFRFSSLSDYIRRYMTDRIILICALGLALFFAINQELLAIYGGYLKMNLNASANFALSSIGLAGIGILFGALYAAKLSRGFIDVAFIPVSGLALSLGLYFLSSLHSLFLISVVMLGYGFFAGMMLVPLNALIQFYSKRKHLGKVLAANNFIQTIAMVGYLLIGGVLTWAGVSLLGQMYGLCVLALVGAVGSLFAFPYALYRYVLLFLFFMRCSMRVSGLDNVPSSRPSCWIGSRVSSIDWLLLQMASPKRLRFVMNPSDCSSWLLKKIFKWSGMIACTGKPNDKVIEQMRLALNQGQSVCVILDPKQDDSTVTLDSYQWIASSLADLKLVVLPYSIAFAGGSRSIKRVEQSKVSGLLARCLVSLKLGEEVTAP